MATRPLTIPLTMSYDTRGVASYTAMVAGKDQRRENCQYVITRTSVEGKPDIKLARRPGVTIDAGTYGAGTQVQYLVARDPNGTQNPTAWLLVKDGTISKAVTSATATTILDNTNFYPRFWDLTDVSGTNYIVVQLQNSTTPTGAGNQEAWYSTAIATWTKISDADFTGLDHRGKAEFMDGYMFQAEHRNRIYQSDINSLANWDSANYISKSALSDPPQGLMRVNNKILLFGVDTVEPFYNAGNATGSVLSRVTGGQKNIGLGSVAGGGASMVGKTHYYARIGEWAFFIGRYSGSKNDASLIATNGTTFTKLSRPLEDTLLSSSTIYSVNAISFGGKSAIAVQMTLPTATTQKWLMFFVDINEWFLWTSTVYGPVNNTLHFAGATDPQKVYTFEATDTWQDNGTSFDMVVQLKLPFNGFDWKTMTDFGVIADTPGSTQNLGVQFSNDDGTTWTTSRDIDLSKENKRMYRCGTFRQRMVRLTHSGTAEVGLRELSIGM